MQKPYEFLGKENAYDCLGSEIQSLIRRAVGEAVKEVSTFIEWEMGEEESAVLTLPVIIDQVEETAVTVFGEYLNPEMDPHYQVPAFFVEAIGDYIKDQVRIRPVLRSN